MDTPTLDLTPDDESTLPWRPPGADVALSVLGTQLEGLLAEMRRAEVRAILRRRTEIRILVLLCVLAGLFGAGLTQLISG